MKIIITGGKGLLASNILPVFSSSHDLIISDIVCDKQPRADSCSPQIEAGNSGTILWDITDPRRGEEIMQQYSPDAVINLAATTNVDGCEDNAELSMKVNGEGPGILAEICQKYGVRFVHISTDYVFDGKKNSPYNEGDKPNPLSCYGLTKFAGEMKAIQKDPSSLIIRAEWVYGDGGENFITKITGAAREKGSVEVVDDQRGSPTYARDLAYPLKVLIEQGRSGIYHIANSGSCTWFEFAREIFSQLHMDIQVKPITSAQLNRRAKRPAYSVYDCSKLQRDTGVTLRSWQEALREYLTNLQ